ncbi:hypothetical protein [Pendulispora albinea]|uniref:DUF3592 domain-containing protein n=1 Tax=Pendulispora albinea TaxID=2741071 RepID=A0ABZ2LS41_9BACT
MRDLHRAQDAQAFPGDPAREELDPELLELPEPPRRERTWTLALLIFTALASLAMVFSLARDAAYAFAQPEPFDAGELLTLRPGDVGQNRFTTARGMLGASGAIRYERPFESDSYRLAPVAGRSDLWVEIRVPSGQESARFVPPSTFTGRLVRFDATGPRHRGLHARINEGGASAPESSWLLVDGETPGRARWSLALMALFMGFAVWNVVTFVRLTRRVR